jgi:hypothetical protein
MLLAPAYGKLCSSLIHVLLVDTSAHPITLVIDSVLSLERDDEFLVASQRAAPDQQFALQKVFDAARAVKNRLAAAPASIVPSSAIANMQNYLQAAHNELMHFRANGNVGHINNAVANLEALYPQLAMIPAPEMTAPVLGELLDALREREAQITRLQTQRQADFGAALDALTQAVAEQERRLAAQVETLEQQRRDAMTVTAELRSEYQEIESAFKTQFAERLTSLRQEFDEFQAKAQEAAQRTIEGLQKNERDARQIVQVVGNIGVTGNYQATAAREAQQADTFRRLTIGFFGLGVGIALIVLVSHLFPELLPWTRGQGEVSGLELALRLLTALAITAPAFYTGRESARHRSNADRAKQRELELASLGPFIELLPNEKKEQIVERLTERYFGTDVQAHEFKPILDPRDVIALANKAVDGLSSVAKR